MHAMTLPFWRSPLGLVLLVFSLLPIAAYNPVLITGTSVVASFLALFWAYGRYHRTYFAQKDLTLWLVAFLGWALISCAWSLAPMKGMQSALLVSVTLLGGLAGVNLLAQHLKDEQRLVLQRNVMYAVIIALGLIAVELFCNQPVYRAIRLVAGIPVDADFNISAYNRAITIFAVLSWPAALAAWQHRFKLLAVVTVIVAFIVSALGQSMSAALGMGLGLVVFAIARLQPAMAYQLCRLMVVVGFAGVFTAVAIINKIPQLQDPHLGNSITQRVEIWSFAAKRIQKPQHFVQGYGLEASRQIPNMGQDSKFLNKGEHIIPIHPHDAILHIWLELGMIGAALAVGVLLTLLKYIRQLAVEQQRIALTVFATAFGISLTAYGLWTDWWLATFILAAMAVVIVKPEKPLPIGLENKG